jgi:hypothetical protein
MRKVTGQLQPGAAGCRGGDLPARERGHAHRERATGATGATRATGRHRHPRRRSSVRCALSAKNIRSCQRAPAALSAILTSSECPYGAYYAAAEGSLPAAVGVQPESGQFPLAILRVVRKNTPRGVAGRSARQVQDEVVVLGHCLSLCASRRSAQDHTGNTLDGFEGCKDKSRDGHFVAAPRMVLAAEVTPDGHGRPPAGQATALM